MYDPSPEILPDLIVNACPFGCNQECAKVWINKTIGHRIVCKCTCDHNKKQMTLQSVGQPAVNVISMVKLTQEETLR